jgi:hypothetical protein
MTTVLASAADRRYGYWLLNLLGSVKKNSDVFDSVVVFDLGLSPFQRRLVDAVRGVEVRTVPPFVPHWAQCYTWKPWIWTHLEGDELVWLDAGVSVLRPLDEPLRQIRERGYFLVSQGHPLEWIVPTDYYELYGLAAEIGSEPSVAAGIMGFARASKFYTDVVVPTYQDAIAGRNLGFSQGESSLGFGLSSGAGDVARDCRHFRHDQTLLNLRLRSALTDPHVNDLDEFGGWKGPRDHPQQVVWNHRRRGDFRFLHAAPFKPSLLPLAKAWAVSFRWRWWAKNHGWLFRPSTYAQKGRRVAGEALADARRRLGAPQPPAK